MPKHFEAHGDRWEVFGLLEEPDTLVKLIRYCVENGIMQKEMVSSIAATDKKIVPLIYPSLGDMQICALIEKSDKESQFISMYPLMEGIANELRIEDIYTWKNGIEGEVICTFADKIEVSFFAPFYHKEFIDSNINKKEMIWLAGLASSVKNANGEKYEIDKGPFYEMQLAEFLKENPNKTPNDFPFVTVLTKGLAAMLPTSYFCEYEYRGTIENIRYLDFFGEQCAKIKICIVRPDDKQLKINLYISKFILKGYIPKKGDDIRGVMWLTGYLKKKVIKYK
jgi:hypothetical protein